MCLALIHQDGTISGTFYGRGMKAILAQNLQHSVAINDKIDVRYVKHGPFGTKRPTFRTK